VAPLLQVYDMPTSIRFYRDVLGFTVWASSEPGDDCNRCGLRLHGWEKACGIEPKTLAQKTHPTSAISFCFTPGHSAATIEYRQESRGMKSAAIRCARRTPSNFAPMRSIAVRERRLRASV
jgi:catechol 2,3-dioxygenase-like lactoylglutathione lyase family enzyme